MFTISPPLFCSRTSASHISPVTCCSCAVTQTDSARARRNERSTLPSSSSGCRQERESHRSIASSMMRSPRARVKVECEVRNRRSVQCLHKLKLGMLHLRRDRTAFAISGGGARGAIQVGMLRALIERDITPDFVVGVSIGAWNGAWLAHRPDLEWVKKLEEVWRQVTRRTLDIVWWRAARNMVRRKPSLYEGGGLSRFVARHLQVHNFEDLAVPLHTVAIDLKIGRASCRE